MAENVVRDGGGRRVWHRACQLHRCRYGGIAIAKARRAMYCKSGMDTISIKKIGNLYRLKDGIDGLCRSRTKWCSLRIEENISQKSVPFFCIIPSVYLVLLQRSTGVKRVIAN